MYEIPKKLLEELESAGFVVSKEEVIKEEDQYYLFKKCSPAGQDFSFYARGNTKEELCEYIHDVWGDYDVSEETMVWLDEFGHGKNGAPYKMEDVLKDMQCCEQYIYNAYEIVKNFTENPVIYEIFFSLQTFIIAKCYLFNVENETPKTFSGTIHDEIKVSGRRFTLNKERLLKVENGVYGKGQYDKKQYLKTFVMASSEDEALNKAKHLFIQYLSEKIDSLKKMWGINDELRNRL